MEGPQAPSHPRSLPKWTCLAFDVWKIKISRPNDLGDAPFWMVIKVSPFSSIHSLYLNKHDLLIIIISKQASEAFLSKNPVAIKVFFVT